MIITCEECRARFRMADEKLKPGGTKVRCSKCKHVFTVLPPESPQAEEVVDYGDFNMERVTDEEPAPTPPATSAQPPEPPEPSTAPNIEPAAAATGGVELDFSGLEQAMGPGTGDNELVEEFSFADTSAAAEPPADEEPAPTTGDFVVEGFPGESGTSGELDFDATFAETEEPTVAPPTAGPSEFAFDQEFAESGSPEIPVDSATFDLASEAEASGLKEFGFEPETGEESAAFGQGLTAAEPAESFEFGTGDTFESSAAAEEPAAAEPAESFEFGTGDTFESSASAEEPAAAEPAESFEFGTGDAFESSAAEPALGEDGASPWEQPEKEEGPSFDFDEPNFETKTEGKVAKGRDEAGLSFGEIDFSDGDSEETPSFGGEPDFSQATLARPAETEAPPPPPPSPRPAVERPRGGEPLPAPALPRKSPMSRVMLMLVLLLMILCGAGGYFYFMGNGQQIVDSLLLKAKGEAPSTPVEQRIGLNITGSSYVNNREAGQLLVVQGTATNNFTTTRTAISVKGVLLDAAGKVLQQQTIFCGNYLDEEKLRSMKYAQIEEAMNNQFGDSLSNMNVSPGKVLNFTIVFRNIPKEMANINVEVVDSKPGGT
ncbi:MAG: zinc-ribbon domain-containing protein [Desulfuromonadales bacterium]|nr:zinc-ribbon domain-containing protein [Desulfuromonadales bacterium]